VGTLGGTTGEGPIPIGLVLVTTYRPGAQWAPRELSSGAGALALLSHTVPAQERPDDTLRAIKLALEDAIVLEGERGEADALAPLLLDGAWTARAEARPSA
jgi:hypothetical protein